VARLFVGPREHDLISDLTKELCKDISGQKIYYYSISVDRTHTHPVYNEAPDKVFDPPIEIEALVSPPEYGTVTNTFGIDQTFKIDVYIQWRDLIDKNIDMEMGDFFSYGEILYEIASINFLKPVYGQIEHKDGVKVTGIRARQGQLNVRVLGPTDVSRTDPDAVQDEFVQQRGERENKLGPTNDRRELIEGGTLDPALTGPREISHVGGGAGGRSPAFYDE